MGLPFSGMVLVAALTVALLIGRAAGALQDALVVAPAAAQSFRSAAQDGGAAHNLVSYHTDVTPATDGQVDDIWLQASPLALTMTRGLGSTHSAADVQMRSLHTETTVYFQAQWQGDPPPAEDNAIFNMLTVHWSIPQAAENLQPLSCAVACHTGYANGVGRFVSTSTVTIPQGDRGTLPAGGGWKDGVWTLVWSRPLISANPYDVQFTDLSHSYEFFVKVFERVDGRADPLSRTHLLVFKP
jgi:hypothetical protein